MLDYCYTILGYKFGEIKFAVRYISAPDDCSAFVLLRELLYNIEMWDEFYVYQIEHK